MERLERVGSGIIFNGYQAAAIACLASYFEDECWSNGFGVNEFKRLATWILRPSRRCEDCPDGFSLWDAIGLYGASCGLSFEEHDKLIQLGATFSPSKEPALDANVD